MMMKNATDAIPMTLLNTSIITAYGCYTYEPITLEQAREYVQRDGYQSAIGHAATAEIMAELLGVPVVVNRIQYVQEPSMQAIVFKLRGRAPEGTILSRDEVEQIGYDFGLLTRTA